MRAVRSNLSPTSTLVLDIVRVSVNDGGVCALAGVGLVAISNSAIAKRAAMRLSTSLALMCGGGGGKTVVRFNAAQYTACKSRKGWKRWIQDTDPLKWIDEYNISPLSIVKL